MVPFGTQLTLDDQLEINVDLWKRPNVGRNGDKLKGKGESCEEKKDQE